MGAVLYLVGVALLLYYTYHETLLLSSDQRIIGYGTMALVIFVAISLLSLPLLIRYLARSQRQVRQLAAQPAAQPRTYEQLSQKEQHLYMQAWPDQRDSMNFDVGYDKTNENYIDENNETEDYRAFRQWVEREEVRRLLELQKNKQVPMQWDVVQWEPQQQVENPRLQRAKHMD